MSTDPEPQAWNVATTLADLRAVEAASDRVLCRASRLAGRAGAPARFPGRRSRRVAAPGDTRRCADRGDHRPVDPDVGGAVRAGAAFCQTPSSDDAPSGFRVLFVRSGRPRMAG